MATFSIDGYEIFSGANREVSDIKPAKLQIVSGLGAASLDFNYATEDPDSAEVALSDYNILLSGLHLNDGPLPDRIELFTLSWSSKTGQDHAQVLNFAFQQGDGWRDCLFAVGQSALPDLSDPQQVSNLLETAQFAVIDKPTMDRGFRLQLEDMPGVSVDGVIYKLFEDEAAAQDHQDQFQFFHRSGAEPQGVTEFDIITRTANARAQSQDVDTNTTALDFDPWDDDPSPLPGAEDFIG